MAQKRFLQSIIFDRGDQQGSACLGPVYFLSQIVEISHCIVNFARAHLYM